MDHKSPFRGNIEKLTIKNKKYYRKVIYTDKNTQLVLMSIRVGDDIEKETHPHTTQFIRVESGSASVNIDERVYRLKDGDAIIIPAGSEHYIRNNSKREPLQLYTLYSPPVHEDETTEEYEQ